MRFTMDFSDVDWNEYRKEVLQYLKENGIVSKIKHFHHKHSTLKDLEVLIKKDNK